MSTENYSCSPYLSYPYAPPNWGGHGWGKPAPIVGAYGPLRNALIICVRKLQKLIRCHDQRIAQNTCDIKANACKIEELQSKIDALTHLVNQNTCKIQANSDHIATNKDTLCGHEAWLKYLARTTCYIDDFPKNPPLNWAIDCQPWGTWA